MLNSFKQAARLITPRSVAIIATESDHPTRGDLHGLYGITDHIEKVTGAEIIKITPEILNTLYGSDSTFKDKLRTYFTDHARPDIILATQEMLRHIPYGDPLFKNALYLPRTNETRLFRAANDLELVPHHLSAQDFEQARKEFEENYPDIEGELITIMFTTNYEAQKSARRVAASLAQHDGATLFICTCGRTLDHEYEAFKETLEQELNARGANLRIIGHNLSAETKRGKPNPYKGLLAKSDHFLVIGNSTSIVSEILASGKSVHGENIHISSPNLVRNGYAVNIFDRADHNLPLTTQSVVPPNVTRDIADKILAQYTRFTICSPIATIRRSLKR